MKGSEVAEPQQTCTGDTPLEGYYITADPITPGTTGTRFFATNVSLVIYENTESFNGKTPEFGSPALGQEVTRRTRQMTGIVTTGTTA